ncbi:MAG TPA: hypothetical protein VLF66_13420, partial [Thermoanaerobaculia bacterium]|nr:hypothetical protein [Thermoanaerobaculia bacterium]
MSGPASTVEAPPVAVRIVPEPPGVLRELEARAAGLDRKGAAAAVRDLLGRREVPLLEGGRATFLYRGEADAVRLRHWIFGLEPDPPFRRLAGTDLWALTLELPAGS